jgi:hypothetical protein
MSHQRNDWRKLKVGDKVRLLCVPEADLKQREHEVASGAEMAGWTADTIERILSIDPVVTIDEVDEYGMPWFSYELTADDGIIEYHSLGITDNDSWEYIAIA